MQLRKMRLCFVHNCAGIADRAVADGVALARLCIRSELDAQFFVALATLYHLLSVCINEECKTEDLEQGMFFAILDSETIRVRVFRSDAVRKLYSWSFRDTGQTCVGPVSCCQCRQWKLSRNCAYDIPLMQVVLRNLARDRSHSFTVVGFDRLPNVTMACVVQGIIKPEP